MTTARPSRAATLSLFILLALTALCADRALPAATGFDWAISVATDPFNYGRELSLQPGESALLYVVGDDIAPDYPEGMRAIQFAVEVDPRLIVMQRYPTTDASVVFNRGPDEWLMGFTDCIRADGEPYLLMSYQLMLPADAVDIADLTISVGDLSSTGEPMAYTSCFDDTRLETLGNAGRAVINPSSPRILNFLGSHEVLVEGRSARLVWETHGAGTVELDGGPVAQDGETTVSPSSSTLFTLVADPGPGSDTAAWNIDVIREPRIDLFTVEPFVQNNRIRAAVEWQVTGASTVQLSGRQEPLPTHGTLVVDLLDPPIWTLSATNEWGTSDQIATLGPLEDLPPFIVAFSASPNPFTTGQEVRLSYQLFNADTATLDPGLGSVDPESGEISLFPTNSTNFTLTASNANDSVSQELFVQLLPAGINYFRAAPSIVYAGDSTTLEWSVGAGLDLVISPGVGPVSGETGTVVVTPPADGTVYTLSASNAEGSVSSDVIVHWKVPTVALAASNENPFAIQTIDLTATIEGADTATLDPVFGAIDPAGGVFSTVVDQPTLFVLTASNAKGSASANVSITPRLPVASIAVSDPNPWPYDPVDLTVNIAGASSATIEPGIGIIDPVNAVISVVVEQPTIFVLTATSAAGSVTAEVSVDPKLPVASLSASDLAPFPQNAIDLTAVVEGATGATLEPGFGLIDPGGGVFSTNVPVTTSFLLTAVNARGTTTAEVTVEPRAPVVALAASPLSPFVGESVEFTATIEGADSASLDPLFGGIPVEGGVFSAVVAETTQVVLTATSTAGTSTAKITITPIEPGPPTILQFTPSASQIDYGEPVSFAWNVEHADEITIEPGGFSTTEASGTTALFPTGEITNFMLTATNQYGSSSAQVEIVQKPFRIVSFEATPNSILAGETVTISWEVIGVASVHIDPLGPQPLVGTLSVQPQEDVTYTLTATNSSWIETRSETVTVGLPGSGQIVLSWSVDSYQPDGYQIGAGIPFSVYVLALEPVGGIFGFEFGIDLPDVPCLIPLGRTTYPSSALDVGPGDDNWIVGTGFCVPSAAVVPLVEYYFLTFVPSCTSNGLMQILPSDPSSFGGTTPGYLTCNEELVAFVTGPPLVMNDSGLVPVVTVDLQLREVSSGLEASWQLPGNEDPRTLKILRAEEDELPRELVSLSGNTARARGSYVDADARPGVRYRYRVLAERDGVSYASEEVGAMRGQGEIAARNRSRLLTNVPNPFNPQTEIRFELARDGAPRLEIFDSAGRRVRAVQLGQVSSGTVQSWVWNGKDEHGLEVSSGVYHVRLIAGDQVDGRSISLIR